MIIGSADNFQTRSKQIGVIGLPSLLNSCRHYLASGFLLYEKLPQTRQLFDWLFDSLYSFGTVFAVGVDREPIITQLAVLAFAQATGGIISAARLAQR